MYEITKCSWLHNAMTCCMVLMIALVTGCAMNPVTGRSELVSSQLSTSEQVDLGMHTFPAVIQQMGGEVPDLQLQGYVQKVGSLLVTAGHRAELDFQFRVVNQPLPNAFSLPGGYVVITRGLLAHLENEAQLAAVLGHAIAHVTAKHVLQGGRHKQIAQFAAALSGRGGDAGFSPLALQTGKVASLLLDNRFTREQEQEADRLGSDYMVAAGYDPMGAIGVQGIFDRKFDRERHPDWMDNLFRTHPYSSKRPESNRDHIMTTHAAVVGSPGAATGEEAFSEAVRYVVETEPGYQIYSQALSQEAAGEPNLAIQTLHEALKSAPDEALIHTAIGLAYLRQEDLLSARRYLRQAVGLDSDHYQPQLGLGYVYLKREEFARAITFLERSVARLATNQGVFLLGEAYLASGQKGEATLRYRSVADFEPQGRLGQAAARRLAELEAR